jgi:hypothetical protein
MSNAHTPGPWVLTIKPAAHDADFTVAEIEQPRSVKYRGAVTRMQSAEHIYGIGREELIANARLISAAPDMLDALEQCAEYFDKFADADHDQDGFVPNEAMQMLTLVMNAIAKTEGRT